jgi:hypothetical protein
MAGMYPDNESVEIFGKTVSWPGVGEDGKFTNGSFSDPEVRPSFIPAETVNLILDNLTELLTALGKTPDNTGTSQLKEALTAALSAKAPLAGPVFTGVPRVPNKTASAANDGTLIATEAQVAALQSAVDCKAGSASNGLSMSGTTISMLTSMTSTSDLPVGSFILIGKIHSQMTLDNFPLNGSVTPYVSGITGYNYITGYTLKVNKKDEEILGTALTGDWRVFGITRISDDAEIAESSATILLLRRVS